MNTKFIPSIEECERISETMKRTWDINWKLISAENRIEVLKSGLNQNLTTTMKLKIKKLHPAAITPTYGTPGAACFDLYAATVSGMETIGSNIWKDDPVTCDTGLSFEVPEGHVMLVFSRSGHGFKHDVRLANCTGVIDADYRGSVQVKLISDRDDESTRTPPLFVKPGDRIAQALIIPVPTVEFDVVDDLSATTRGDGGFGSTGS